MKVVYLSFVFVMIFAGLQNTDGLLNLPKIKLKPVLKTVTGTAGSLTDFTLNEILNFHSFKSLFNKIYNTVESENMALLNFLINQREVEVHNRKYDKGMVSYQRGLCEYSDMSNEDMNKYVNRFKMPDIVRRRRDKEVVEMDAGDLRAERNEIKEIGNSDENFEEYESERFYYSEESEDFVDDIDENNEQRKLKSKFKTGTDEIESEDTKSHSKVQNNAMNSTSSNKISKKSRKSQNKPKDSSKIATTDEKNYESTEKTLNDNKELQKSTVDFISYDDNDYEPELLPERSKPLLTLKYSADESITSDDDILNYVTKGFTSPVLNQGVCGACWSFASVAAIEAAWFLKTKKLIKLSAQQLIDCNRDEENTGCDGGNMVSAFEFIEEIEGITLESKYPYNENDTYDCLDVDPYVKIKSHVLIDAGDEDLLLKKLIKNGPIAVAIDASQKTFQTYRKGVFYDPKCSKDVNHAMLLVGYGTVKKTKEDYWILKNTYGKTWGINGYMRLARNRENHCGITEFAAYPVC